MLFHRISLFVGTQLVLIAFRTASCLRGIFERWLMLVLSTSRLNILMYKMVSLVLLFIDRLNVKKQLYIFTFFNTLLLFFILYFTIIECKNI